MTSLSNSLWLTITGSLISLLLIVGAYAYHGDKELLEYKSDKKLLEYKIYQLEEQVSSQPSLSRKRQ
jgi:hypothetical protein